uniref:SH2 domain-containing protein n=1 Tax=Heterorhabditis bacteriophora TaxID=37862 RepID=A0A1I7WNF2_HETBA
MTKDLNWVAAIEGSDGQPLTTSLNADITARINKTRSIPVSLVCILRTLNCRGSPDPADPTSDTPPCVSTHLDKVGDAWLPRQTQSRPVDQINFNFEVHPVLDATAGGLLASFKEIDDGPRVPSFTRAEARTQRVQSDTALAISDLEAICQLGESMDDDSKTSTPALARHSASPAPSIRPGGLPQLSPLESARLKMAVGRLRMRDDNEHHAPDWIAKRLLSGQSTKIFGSIHHICERKNSVRRPRGSRKSSALPISHSNLDQQRPMLQRSFSDFAHMTSWEKLLDNLNNYEFLLLKISTYVVTAFSTTPESPYVDTESDDECDPPPPPKSLMGGFPIGPSPCASGTVSGSSLTMFSMANSPAQIPKLPSRSSPSVDAQKAKSVPMQSMPKLERQEKRKIRRKKKSRIRLFFRTPLYNYCIYIIYSRKNSRHQKNVESERLKEVKKKNSSSTTTLDSFMPSSSKATPPSPVPMPFGLGSLKNFKIPKVRLFSFI